MSCRACQVLAQYGYNYLLILDKLGNTVLLGDPNETLSRRTARARDAGDRFGRIGCAILEFFSKNHCAWSLEPGSLGRELWSWSRADEHPKIVRTPVKMEPRNDN